MILVIDNYDSFTYNVVQALQRLSGDEVKVVRSKEVSLEELDTMEKDPAHALKRLFLRPAKSE